MYSIPRDSFASREREISEGDSGHQGQKREPALLRVSVTDILSSLLDETRSDMMKTSHQNWSVLARENEWPAGGPALRYIAEGDAVFARLNGWYPDGAGRGCGVWDVMGGLNAEYPPFGGAGVLLGAPGVKLRGIALACGGGVAR